MKTLIYFILFFPSLVFGHCPLELNIQGQSYCADLQWQKGEKKVQGQFKSTEQLSPQLVPMGQRPKKWIYSKVFINIWEKIDDNHLPQQIPDLRIFPYMMMQNGHHHSTSFDFSWNSSSQSYVLSQMAFQEMMGCWSLRWTLSEKQTLADSHELSTVSNYNNLSHHENLEMKQFCQKPSGGHGGEHGEGHHH